MSLASQTLQQCLDQAENHGGEPPTCTEIDGSWVASWPSDGMGGGDFGGIMVLAVIGVLLSLALVAWKVSTARTLATQAGMDPSLATNMTLLTDSGLEATYVASSLRTPKSASPASDKTTAGRLGELKALLDAGLITQAEHDDRRRAIIDAV